MLAAVAQCGVAGRGLASGWTPLALHAVTAGLVYLLFVNLTTRKLGAPLIAAVLFGAHPLNAASLAAGGAAWGAAGAALGLLSGILLARSPREPRLLWPSLAAYAASLPLAPGGAAIPFLVAAGVVAYHGLEPSRLFTKRLLPRFAAFLVPLAAWIVWTFVARDATPTGFGSAPAFVAGIVAPFGSADVHGAVVGAAIAAASIAVGLLRLRAAPKFAWPLLAFGASLAAAALAPSASVSFSAALAFAALLVAEGIERLFHRFGGAVAMPLTLIVWAALAVESHLAAR